MSSDVGWTFSAINIFPELMPNGPPTGDVVFTSDSPRSIVIFSLVESSNN